MKTSQLLMALASAVAVAGFGISPRPSLKAMPYEPTARFPTPGFRDGRVCVVDSHHDDLADDSHFILSAFHECNYGGHVLFPRGVSYTIGTAMDWTFLRNIDVDIQGYIKFTNDTTYWQAHSFPFVFQNATSFFKLGGDDVWFYGGHHPWYYPPQNTKYNGTYSLCYIYGTLDGNGQVWYDLYAADIYILRPVLFGIDGLHNSVFSGLNLRYSPQYYHFVANSTNVVWDSISIAGYSTSNNTAKNTDGWDTYRSSDLTIQNSIIQNGDDCVSFKPNSTNMLVQSLSCTGSHGISVGSLGQYVGEFDIVENVMVSNISMHNTSDGARIKVWPNTPSAMSGDLQGGGGSGRVLNVTYEDFAIDNVAYAIEITQCYGQTNLTLCTEYPSPLAIEDIVFRNFSGVTSTQYMPLVAAFACSSEAVCGNITAADIDVRSPNGTDLAYCLNQDEAMLDVQCTDDYLGFN